MTITDPVRKARNSERASVIGPIEALTGALATAVVFAAILQPSILREALVPATATLIFALAALLALIAWLRPVPQQQFTYWDAAGILTFIGVCAAAMVGPEQMLQLVAGTEQPR
jgi:hypothetical protein